MDHKIQDLDKLIRLAISLGASDARVIPSDEIQVREQLANKCVEPQCENYGLSYSCPPYVTGPNGFRKLQKNLPMAIALRLVVPASTLLSWERGELGKFLHELVASVEHEAVDLGYLQSTAFAGGSCKELFCSDHLACRRISEDGDCRHPEVARPSLSGFGVDVFALMESCGWQTNINISGEKDDESLSWVAGLILIG